MTPSLDRLAAAAERRDYGQAEDAVRRLLSRCPLVFGFALVEVRIRDGLGRFLAAHPADVWAVRALEGDMGEHGPPEYEGPGENHLVSAIVRLNAGRAEMHDPERSLPHLAAAICSTVASAGWAAYGRKHPKAWSALSSRLRRHAPLGRRLLEFAAAYFADADAHEAEMREWAAVTEALAAFQVSSEVGARGAEPHEGADGVMSESLRRLTEDIEGRRTADAVDALWSILSRGSASFALRLAEDRIRQGLSRLLSNHPGDTWAVRALAGSAERPPAYASPGDAMLASAIESFNAGWSTPYDARGGYGIASAIATTALSAGWAEYGRKHPEEWAWYVRAPAEAREDERRQAFLAGYWADPEAYEAEKREWDAIIATLTTMPVAE